MLLYRKNVDQLPPNSTDRSVWFLHIPFPFCICVEQFGLKALRLLNEKLVSEYSMLIST